MQISNKSEGYLSNQKLSVLLKSGLHTKIKTRSDLADALGVSEYTVKKWYRKVVDDVIIEKPQPPLKHLTTILTLFEIDDISVLKLTEDQFKQWCLQQKLNREKDHASDTSNEAIPLSEAVHDFLFSTENAVKKLGEGLLSKPVIEEVVEDYNKAVTRLVVKQDEYAKDLPESLKDTFKNSLMTTLKEIDRTIHLFNPIIEGILYKDATPNPDLIDKSNLDNISMNLDKLKHTWQKLIA